ncbi:hypothetical protein [Actinomycetospora termitidis]|uniref:Uncharacterized protein n=1 Tax=Actinomycetospora termitidis TaxID=3053470 RepID=A0ABT7MG00_9PSEU|nr:hypothetical protein [Actinomycetospora sp. Odt1-22]MDL5158892.1 hypothetical protein [Actinomycetospora sp. Odt1-22]
MTAFGGVFRSPKLEGVEEGEDSGQRAQIVGLDLESGVVRLRAAQPAAAQDDDEPSASD